jgi:hypothetical protein
MARTKRTAEDVVRLIHLERDPLPPSEWAKISAWLKTEARKATRPWMVLVVGLWFALCAFLLCAALVLSPSQLHEISEFMISEFTTLFMALVTTAVAVLALVREVTRIGFPFICVSGSFSTQSKIGAGCSRESPRAPMQ